MHWYLKNMKLISLIFATTFLFSCGQQNVSKHIKIDSPESEIRPDFNVALTFINQYASFCTPTSSSTSDSNWVRNNTLLTDNFKGHYFALLDSGLKIDPEIGLGFDPIFDAQDFPDSGFVVSSTDEKTGLVTVRGKDWPRYLLVLKVITQNNKSLVDGSGVINIPEDKRAKR